jgi:SAM-dependent methyltransferase
VSRTRIRLLRYPSRNSCHAEEQVQFKRTSFQSVLRAVQLAESACGSSALRQKILLNCRKAVACSVTERGRSNAHGKNVDHVFHTMPPPDDVKSLYCDADLYSLLRPPDMAMMADARKLISEHLVGPFSSIFDPACGPGDVLVYFGSQGLGVAGNDLSQEMYRRASAAVAPFAGEITQRDMKDLAFASRVFDAAVELSGVISELSPTEMTAHIRSVLFHLRPGGVYIFSLIYGEADFEPRVPSISYTRAVQSQTGSYSIVYEVVGWDELSRTLSLRRMVFGSDTLLLNDKYALHVYNASETATAVSLAGGQLLQLKQVTNDDEKLADFYGIPEVLVAIRCPVGHDSPS